MADQEQTPAQGRALVVEDEPNIRELVELHLKLEGLTVTSVADGEDALRAVADDAFDVVVLDLMLPKIDGVTVCRAIRRQASPNQDVPILMLTARREESDKVLGLDSGADDYLKKPFGVRELVARVRAMFRSPRSRPGLGDTTAVISAGPLKVDPARRQVHRGNDSIDLTPHEFDVLYLLASHPGIVLSRETLLDKVWTADIHVTERSVDTLIKRLRQKVEVNPAEPELILTVWGSGYKFADHA